MQPPQTITRFHSLAILIAALLCLTTLSSPASDNPATSDADVIARNTQLQGYLTLRTKKALDLEIIRDDYGNAQDPALLMAQLPAFSFAYVQEGEHLIPLRRGAIRTGHPLWEYILEPGRLWRDPDQPTATKVSLPIALQERNADCTHNGLLSFLIRTDGTASRAQVEFASETCLYQKFNLTGSLAATYQPDDLPQAEAVRADFRAQRTARLTTRPIAALLAKHPTIAPGAFSGNGRLPTQHISQYGFVIDDVHYRGECQTRMGAYPFCDEMSLPSYSLAKTLFAGLAAMRLEKLYPGSRQALIADYVPECRGSGNWDDVTFEQTLNMVSGNYGSASGRDDESAKRTDDGFFLKSRHDDKINFSCNAWPRRARPGTQWTYHTSDTYILGTAMNAFLRERQGPEADIFENLVLPLWQPLSLNPAIAVTRRSYDDRVQPFTGFGLALLADDIARLAMSLNQGSFAGLLDSEMYNSAMQRLDQPRGHFPVDDRFYYSHGFWALDAQTLLGCDQPVMIPFMTGYGGINVVMMPNNTVYYIFNDGGKFAFTDVVVQSHRIRSMCPRPNNKSSNINPEN